MLRRTVIVLGAILGLLAGLWTLPAYAACHIAQFNPSSYNTGEGEGKVTITIQLHLDNPGCSGAIKYATENVSATAGKDYTAQQGTVCLGTGPGQDRQTSFDVPIIDDGLDEDVETFRARLSKGSMEGCTEGPNQVIPSDTPATVTIKDNDEAPPPDPDPQPEPPAQEEEQKAEESPEASPSPTEADEEETTPDDDGSPSPGALTFGDEGTNGEDDGGISTAGVVGILGLLIAAGAGVGLWFVNKRKVSGEGDPMEGF